MKALCKEKSLTLKIFQRLHKAPKIKSKILSTVQSTRAKSASASLSLSSLCSFTLCLTSHTQSLGLPIAGCQLPYHLLLSWLLLASPGLRFHVCDMARVGSVASGCPREALLETSASGICFVSMASS